MTLTVSETRSTISSVFLEMRVWGLYCSCVRFRMACPPRKYLGLGIPQVSRLPLAFLRDPRELGVWSWGDRSGPARR